MMMKKIEVFELTVKNLLLKNKNGLTLIELLIAIFIMGIVLTIASSMLIQSFNVVEPATRRMSASQLAELTKREVASYLRTAVDFTHPVENNENKWEFVGYHPSQDDADNKVKFTIELEENGTNSRLILSAEETNGSGEVFEENRVLVNNINTEKEGEGFVITEEIEDDRYNFTIEIRVKDEEGSTANKTTNVRSRNLAL